MTEIYHGLVPVVSRYLRNLDAMLGALESHARDRSIDEEVVLGARLHHDMLPLRMQARVAMDFPFRALRQLLGAPFELAPPDTTSIGTLREAISLRLDLLAAIEPTQLAGKASVILRDKAGEGRVESAAGPFIGEYVLPNFFFHLCATYFTLRIMGVPVGKQDFDGFHVYPPGFSLG